LPEFPDARYEDRFAFSGRTQQSHQKPKRRELNMTRTWQKLKGTFRARDAKGNEYTVQVIATYRELTYLSEPSETVENALKELKLTDGRHVNRIEKGKYAIVGIPMIEITSDDPNAV